MIVKIQIDELLEKQERSFYWLSKQTGISYKTLWRLKKGRALGINFATLEKICVALDCLPGDILTLEEERKAGKRISEINREARAVSKTQALVIDSE